MQKMHAVYGKRRVATPQNEPIPGRESEMEENNAGGYTFTIDSWSQLSRFLILGSAGGTYYVTERKLTRENAQVVEKCLLLDGKRVVDEVVRVSVGGLAAKVDSQIFVLAMAAGTEDEETRKYALSQLKAVCRTASHLFMFVEYVEAFRGWGRGLVKAVADWYQSRRPSWLGYQMAKYQQRNGWSHRDLLRLSHPKPVDKAHNHLYAWAAGKVAWLDDAPYLAKKRESGELVRTRVRAELPTVVEAMHTAMGLRDEKKIAMLVREYGLTHEMVPNEVKKSKVVWEALLEGMPLTAMIRNLGRMTAIELIKPLSTSTRVVVDKLADGEYLRKSRVHPITVLAALKQYASGAGDKGSLTWKPVQQVVDALDDAFYAAFSNVEPVNKDMLLALDVSGSMFGEWVGRRVVGFSSLNAAEVSAAMALVTANVEPNYAIVGFSTTNLHHWNRSDDMLVDVRISPRMRLDRVLEVIRGIPMGGTDCALPMMWAKEANIGVDCFAVYTDNETWAGRIHPKQALDQYRNSSGRASRLVVNATTSTGFTIADPMDAGMLDMVGFSSNSPAVMSGFFRGEV